MHGEWIRWRGYCQPSPGLRPRLGWSNVHLRGRQGEEPGSSIEGLGEVIAASVVSGAALHVVHIQSTGGPVTPKLLQMVVASRERGLDVTAE